VKICKKRISSKSTPLKPWFYRWKLGWTSFTGRYRLEISRLTEQGKWL